MCAADEPTAWTHPLNVLVTVQSCVLCPAQASVSTTSCTTSSPCATQTRTWTSTSTASSAAWFGSKPCSVSQCLTCAVTNISCGSCGVSPALHPYFTLCVLIFFCFFFCVFEFQSKWFWHLLWKEFNVKIHFYQPNSQSLIVWMGPSTLHTPNPVNLVSFMGSCVESEMQRDVFFSSGAFQAFDQDGDGTIRLSVLEVRATTACQLWGRSTKTWIRFRGVKSKVLKYKVVKYLEFVPY